MTDLLGLIRRRRTARGRFKPDPIAAAHVRAMLEAARWAPSSHNTQPWKFVVVDSPAVKEEIARLVLDVVRYDRALLEANTPWLRFTRRELGHERDGIYVKYFRLLAPIGRFLLTPAVARCLDAIPALRAFPREMAEFIRQAPLLLCFAFDLGRWFAPGDEDIEGVLGLGACLQNLLLMAAHLGIGCQPLSAPLEVPEGRRRLQRLIGYPDDCVPITLLRLGYEVEPEEGGVRLDLDQIAYRNRFGTLLGDGDAASGS